VTDAESHHWPATGTPGTAAGLAALLERHRGEITRFLRARTGNVAEADDIMQELWLKLQGVRAGPVSNGRAYLFQMANNLVLDRARELRRRHARNRAWVRHEYGPTTDGIEAADPGAGPDRAVLEAEELHRLAAAIEALPEGARRAFCLHKLDGLSHAEVAARLAISRSGVEKHIALAMQHLRRALLAEE
jgi:RNA polymerase sigma factor (sigma-70 family)